jgi:spermidine synthase
MVSATLVALAIHVAVALAAFALSRSQPHASLPSSASELWRIRHAPRADVMNAVASKGTEWRVLVVVALSGFCALGAEVIWTRLLSLLLGGTVYTFSIVLAVLLFGLALGSTIQASVTARVRRPQFVLGVYQFLSAVAIAWAAFVIARILPYWSIDPAAAQNTFVLVELEVVRSLLAILPAACLWGASFSLAVGAVPANPADPARPVGKLYASNTLGAIAGALTTSLWIIPAFGTRGGQQLLIALSALAGILAIGNLERAGVSAPRFTIRLATLGVSCAIALLAVGTVPAVPPMTFAYGRYAASWIGHLRVLYAGEGSESSVAVTETDAGSLSFHVSGKVEASNEPLDMRLQLMLGHVPALVHDNPHSILVVGMGTGITAGSFVLHPDVTRIVIVELEPLVPAVASRYFGPYNNHVEQDRRVQIVRDDARHYVQTTTETFDVITTDPIHPWVKGSAALYTKEYFDLIARRLRPGGVVAQWIPLYETTADVVKTELATFFDVFPRSTIWDNGIGWDIVALGQTGASTIDVDRMDERLNRADHARVLESLRRVQLGSATELLSTYAGRASDLRPWTEAAERNRDLNLRLQYLAGLGLNTDRRQEIYNELLGFSRFPSSLFAGSDEVMKRLKASLDAKELLRRSLAERRAGARQDD